MPDFKYTFMQYSLEKDIFKAKIKPRLEKNPIVNAWGEKTTGCVLDDLLNFFSYMDMDFTFEDIYTSLKPESSVDFKGGYPRPWETITMGERYSRVKNYKDIIMRRVELKKANGNQSS
jgi:hypothetical protein